MNEIIVLLGVALGVAGLMVIAFWIAQNRDETYKRNRRPLSRISGGTALLASSVLSIAFFREGTESSGLAVMTAAALVAIVVLAGVVWLDTKLYERTQRELQESAGGAA